MFQFPESEFDEEVFQDIECMGQLIESITFYNCTFKNCDFSETILKSCKFNDCQFEKCNLSLIGVPDSSFSNTIFNKSKIIGVNWAEARWKKMMVRSSLQFQDCNLNHSTFIGLNLKGLLMQNCIAKEVDFRECDLSHAEFQYTDLTGSNFINTNLTNADFCHAMNYSIKITSNNTLNARFMLPEAMSLLYCLDITLVE